MFGCVGGFLVGSELGRWSARLMIAMKLYKYRKSREKSRMVRQFWTEKCWHNEGVPVSNCVEGFKSNLIVILILCQDANYEPTMTTMVDKFKNIIYCKGHDKSFNVEPCCKVSKAIMLASAICRTKMTLIIQWHA